MRLRARLLAVAAALLFASAAFAADPTSGAGDTAAGDALARDPAGTVLARVNALRATRALPPLRLDPHLCASAAARAADQARAGMMPVPAGTEGILGRVKRDGYEAHSITELLASSSGGLDDVFASWQNRGNASYGELFLVGVHDLGVGVATSDGVTYVAMLLGESWSDFFHEGTRSLADRAAVDDEMLRLTNAARAEAKRPPLRLDRKLGQCAQRYADLMLARSHYGHRGPEGDTVRERAAAAGYGEYEALGENLAQGQFTVAEVMDGWLHSPAHRENLLSPVFTEVGFGVAFGRNDNGWQVLWVQCFGRPRPR
jgi:uncharacterized protein YkwD